MSTEGTTTAAPSHSGLRLALFVLLLLGGAVLGGALIAPHLFNALIRLGRNVEFLAPLRNLEFQRVASRCVVGLLLLGIYPALRATGMTRLSEFGLGARPGWGGSLLRGFGVGFGAVGVIWLLGLAAGAYRIAPDEGGSFLVKVPLYLGGAFVVAFLEELLFRGVIFGMLRKSARFWMPAILSSLLYAVVHFAKPEPSIAVVYGHWDAGLHLFKDMFRLVGSPHDYFPLGVTLFLLGLAFCRFYAGQGNLFFVVGLHAGLIGSMRSGIYFFLREPGVPSWIFGESITVAKSWAACAAALLVFLVAQRTYRVRKT